MLLQHCIRGLFFFFAQSLFAEWLKSNWSVSVFLMLFFFLPFSSSIDKWTRIPCRRVTAQAASQHLWLRLTIRATIQGVQVTFPGGWLRSARLHLPKRLHLHRWSHMACDWSNALRPARWWRTGAGSFLWTYGKGKTLLFAVESHWALFFLHLYLSSVSQVEKN